MGGLRRTVSWVEPGCQTGQLQPDSGLLLEHWENPIFIETVLMPSLSQAYFETQKWPWLPIIYEFQARRSEVASEKLS